MHPKIRATAVLIENDKILLVEQRVGSTDRCWSLPGGTHEYGETLAECLVREVEEETGLRVAITRMLYVCDRITPDEHVLHISFEVHQVGGRLQIGTEPEPDASPITSLRMVPITQLANYGFNATFCNLALTGFPESGRYLGEIENLGL
jgi:ADP-ribose pyrophosphatase YjhB (NUDIX family)